MFRISVVPSLKKFIIPKHCLQKVTLIRDSIVILHNYFNLLHAILQPWDEFVIITKKNVGLTAQYYYNVNITLRNCHSKYIGGIQQLRGSNFA